MTECTRSLFELPACKRRKVETEFKGGDATSDGGILLLRQADRLLGLTTAASRCLNLNPAEGLWHCPGHPGCTAFKMSSPNFCDGKEASRWTGITSLKTCGERV
ncbi:MAG: transposase [Magnetococcales bacterium]|nr:transposase [Magnetococcales bacterium]